MRWILSFHDAQLLLVLEGQPEGNARLLREIELNSDYCAMAKLTRLVGWKTSQSFQEDINFDMFQGTWVGIFQVAVVFV